MHWDRNVIAKSKIVEQIDSEEHEHIWQPSCQRDTPRLEEERRSFDGEVGWPGEDGGDDELDEGDEEALGYVSRF